MLRNYLKIAWKVLLRRKFYTFISLFGISFTILVLMVAVSLFDHVFGPVAPELKADRTLGLYFVQMNSADDRNVSNNLPGYQLLDQYVRTLTTPEKVSVHTFREAVYSYKNGASIESYLKRTDGAFWDIFDFKFVEGGPFTARDDKERNFVAVINEATRQRFFGGERAVGRFLDADGQRFRVVGVVENVPFARITTFSDIWAPITTAKSDEYKTRFMGGFLGTVLARSQKETGKVQEEFASVLARVKPPDPHYAYMTGGLDTPFSVVSRSLFSRRLVEARPARLVSWLLGFAVAFMVLPTVNLVNVNVSRIIERTSEIGVRKAFGASSRTLVGQFIVENVFLTLLGGAIGFAGSWLVLRMLSGGGFLQYAEFQLNFRVFLYGLAVTVFFGVFSGVYPAWKMSRLHPVEALRGGSL